MTGIGFIGVGGMGRHQALAFSKVKSARIQAAADLSPESRKAFSELCPGAKTYDNIEALLADDKVQAVVIAVPTFLHKPLVQMALKAGKPVLCEKPLSLNIADSRQMIETANKTGQLLMTAHCRRYDPTWLKMGSTITTGKIGRPVIWRNLSAGHGPAEAWFNDEKRGGGPMIDGAIHNYDFANLMFGQPVSAIATAIDLTGSTAVNTATALVEYEHGDQLMLSWSWGVAATQAGGMDFLGTTGTLNIGPGQNASPELDRKKYGYLNVTSHKTDKQTLIRTVATDMYVNQAKHFIDCVNKKAECLSPATEAIKGVAVAQAIFKSIKQQGRRTKITW